MRIMQGITINHLCVNWRDYPQISALRKISQETLSDTLEQIIADLVRSLNVKENMNGPQVCDCAQIIISEFWYLRVEDIYLALRRIKTGEKKIFERLDTAVICEAIVELDIEKTGIISKMREGEHAQNKVQWGNTIRKSDGLKLGAIIEREKHAQALDKFIQNKTESNEERKSID